MADYISREAALKAAEHAYGEWNLAMAAADGARQINLVYKRQELLKAVASVFDIVPAADVEPVRHGRWVVDYPDGTIYEGAALRLMFALITCSECGKTFELMRMGKPRYCTCGAKMDLEEQNEP
nr:MAG TPA: hypothetical protein [Caudoviricetes sp.]